ncbi:MAG: DUF58 domain-containing protein [Chloroflexi bacterium]|nr:DUF58 domain-containing protein [Chloroflexota bacterium]
MSGETWYYLIATILLASVLMHNTLLFVVSLALALTLAVSHLWNRYCLEGVEYRRSFSQERAFFGEEIEMVVEIVNRKVLPVAWLEAEDEIPRELEPLKGKVTISYKSGRSLLLNLVSLRWYERVRRHYRIRCDVRGYHSFGPALLRSGDVFGFRVRESVVSGEDRLLIYPRVVPISELGLPPKDPFGDLKARQWLFQDPLRTIGVREYFYGDNPRRIDWKATARTQKLQVKLYEPTTTYQLVILLNLNTYGPFWWWQGYDPDLLELIITTTASVANWAVEQGYQIGLYANGSLRASDTIVKLPPSRDPEQLTRVMETLAMLVPSAAMPLDTLLQTESHKLPFGATLLVVTAVLGDEILAELQALKRAGHHQIALLLLGDHAPQIKLEGIATYRIGGEKAWRELREIAVGGHPEGAD